MSANVPHGTASNAVTLCEFFVSYSPSGISLSDGYHFAFGQLVQSLFLSLGSIFRGSSLLNCIKPVNQSVSKEKVFRSNARCIVPPGAIVENVCPFRDWSKVNFPAHPMGEKGFSIHPKFAIASLCFPSRPKPTGFSLKDFFPKSRQGLTVYGWICKLRLHIQSFVLMCHAPSRSNYVGAFSFWTKNS
jgi:hypothetical protein